MELKYLFTLKKILECGSYQKAAAALGYAQSTITFQIRALEQEFGVQLFERSGGRMVLTQAGGELMPYVDKVLESVDDLNAFRSRREGLTGTLTVAAPETLATYELQSVFAAFRERAPRVRLSVRCRNCFEIFEDLLGSDIDVAIHYDVGDYPPGIACEPLAEFGLALVGSPGLAAAERDFVTPGQKKALSHIQDDSNALSVKIFRRYLEDRSIAMEKDIEVWSTEAVKRFVMSGLGVAFMPRFALEREIAEGRLAELPTAMEHPSMTAVCAWQKGRWKTPAAELFIKLLKEHFALRSQAVLPPGSKRAESREASRPSA
ncbi:MAG: HTH lysR-type domain-containing protein [Burkholderia sp.]|jgi:DNA-binding transcriptional LysR family regulator